MAAKRKPSGKGSGKDLKGWDSTVNAIAEAGMKGWEGPKKDSVAVYKKFSAVKNPTAKDLAAASAYLKSMSPRRGTGPRKVK
jgi:hypothetical protein